MATTPTKPDLAVTTSFTGVSAPAWPRGQNPELGLSTDIPDQNSSEQNPLGEKPSQRDALQALLAFSALHDQVRRRKALAARLAGFDAGAPFVEFEADEQFVLDEVLRLVAERALAITGADGLAIALAENDEIVLRASAGTVRPDVGQRIDRDSAFSGACFRMAEIVTCDDTDTDSRVNLQACRRLGARSMVAVPLCGRRRVIGLLEAFSAWPFAFNESDVRNLSLLAELVLGALKPEDEDRFAQSAQIAATKLEAAPHLVETAAAGLVIPPQIAAPQIVVPQVIAPQVGAPKAAPPASAAAPVVSPRVVAPAVAAATTIATPVVAPPTVSPTTVSPSKSASPIATPKVGAVAATATFVADVAPSKDIASARTTTVLDKPALEKSSDVETSTIAETAVEPEIASEETEPARKRTGMLVLVFCLIVAAAFAGGMWWKLKTQLGGVMMRTEKITPKVAASVAAPAPATNLTPAAASNPTTASDAIPDTNDDTNSPATLQELAKFPKVTGVRHWSSADSSTVVLDLEDQVQYEAHRLANPDRIYFDLHDTQLTADLAGKSIDVGDALINRIRLAQPVAGMTRIVLETKGNSNFSVSLEPNPYRLLVEVRKIGATPKGAVNLFPNADAQKKLMAIVVPPPTKEDLQLRARVPKLRIVVDAGHGGWDLGTVGRRGLLEKDLVLEIAQRLGKLLESRLGMEVIYTRQDDNYIPLDQRAEIANQAQADLFVSVHANYSDLPSARGVETYYTNMFSAPGSKEAGAKDADSVKIVGVKGAIPTLSSADLHERIEQSRRLAASVQRSLYGTLSTQNPGLRDRGIKEAGFVVLTESAMPGILAEVSFVSSPTDEQKLRSDGYREQIAEALYRGIARYAASSKGVRVASK
jgi:N-acetylmuramoyl-L-alanine amidase/putative methionine-R-sulfoxide reductase with GAF domain